MAPTCWLCGSVALWAESSEKGQWPLPAFLTRRKLSPTSLLDAKYFSSSLQATGVFPAATLVSSVRVSLSKFFKGNFLGLQKFLLPFLTGFCSQKLLGLIFLALEAWAEEPGMELELPASEISLPTFYPPHQEVGPACSSSPPLLPV